MLIINTAKCYSDLNYDSIMLGLFEVDEDDVGITEALDCLLDTITDSKDYEITTLSETVIKEVGILVLNGSLDTQDVIIKIFENGSVVDKLLYSEDGSVPNFSEDFYVPL